MGQVVDAGGEGDIGTAFDGEMDWRRLGVVRGCGEEEIGEEGLEDESDGAGTADVDY